LTPAWALFHTNDTLDYECVKVNLTIPHDVSADFYKWDSFSLTPPLSQSFNRKPRDRRNVSSIEQAITTAVRWLAWRCGLELERFFHVFWSAKLIALQRVVLRQGARWFTPSASDG
jgi:hypothetical protein